jgi:biotin carboxyl carrier protein
MKVKVRIGDEERELQVSRRGDMLLIVDGGVERQVRLIHHDGPAFVIEYIDPQSGQPIQRRIRAAGHATGNRRQLWVNGSNVEYERVVERKGASHTSDSSLAATIPAVVAEVLVQVGDTVRPGDRLILLESMKMILPIQAPIAGVVRAIHCEPGQAVQPGYALVELEEL